MSSDDTDPAGSVEAGLAALLDAREEFEPPAARDEAPNPLWPAGRRRGTAPFWRFGFPGIMVVLAIVAVLLFRKGWDEIRNCQCGQVLASSQDPTAPGWEAFTSRTETLLVIQTDAEGAATGFAVLALSSEKAGGVLVIPPSAALPIPGLGNIRFDDAYEKHGIPGAKPGVELLIGAGLGDVAVVDPTTWAALVGPVSPIEVENRDAVKDGGKVVFPTGKVTLAAADVGRYLSIGSTGQSDVNRLIRNETFWETWLTKVALTNSAGALPGESDSGIGKLVRGLTQRKFDVRSLPARPVGGANTEWFSADDVALSAAVTQLIPFPVSPQPGVRLRARLLDGTGNFDHGVKLTPALVQAGTELVSIGNASAFGVGVTQLVYYDDSKFDAVTKISRMLGVGLPTKSTAPSRGVDLEVVLGADAANLIANADKSVITSPPSAAGTTILGGSRGTNR